MYGLIVARSLCCVGSVWHYLRLGGWLSVKNEEALGIIIEDVGEVCH